MKNLVLKYTLIGIIVGIFFPLVSLIMDCCFFHKGNVSLNNFANLIDKNPIHLIILTAPLVLGGAGYIIGSLYQKQISLNEDLNMTNQDLLASNDLLDTFNYHVSHDLKTVMSNQILLSRLLIKYLDKNDLEKVNEISKKLSIAAQNGMETVINFLSISKAGFSIKDDLQEINLESCINEVVSKNNLASEINISTGTKDFSTINFNVNFMESIFLNLITNAIKYNKNEKATMKIDFSKTTTHYIISCTDNGIGIDMDKNSDKLFQPFERITNGISKEGSGVGLYIIKKMLNNFNGEIKVESKLGEGSTFSIYLPQN